MLTVGSVEGWRQRVGRLGLMGSGVEVGIDVVELSAVDERRGPVAGEHDVGHFAVGGVVEEDEEGVARGGRANARASSVRKPGDSDASTGFFLGFFLTT